MSEGNYMNRREFMKAAGISLLVCNTLSDELTQKVKKDKNKYYPTNNNNSNTKVNEDFLKYKMAWREGAIVNRCFLR